MALRWSTVLFLAGTFCFSAVCEGVKTSGVKTSGVKTPLMHVEAQVPKYQELNFRKKVTENIKSSARASVTPPQFYSDIYNARIYGKEMQTIKNRTIYAFQGFKYGAEPTLDTRFKPPLPAGKFFKGDEFHAVHIGFKCPQSAMIGNNIAGEEDCLNLNVYTPYIPSSDNELLPVMFFIHGGGFIGGDTSIYLPTRLLDHDVILVTIHYRLGLLGFFTTQDTNAPGNTAFYDMIEALRWVQEHIGEFGGDKDRVTIFGESAGSASVSYMLILPAARGLFQGVIGESGSALDVWAFDAHPLQTTEYVANYFGCPTNDSQELFDCVVRQDPYDIVKAGNQLVSEDRHNGLLGFRGASPYLQTAVLDGTEGYDLLIEKHPIQYLRDGDSAPVPYMTGANKQEGSYVFGIMYGDYLLYHHLENNETYLTQEMVQDVLRGFGVHDDTYSMANSMTMEYCFDVNLADINSSSQCMIDMLGAMFLKSGSWEVSKLHAYYKNQNSYYYAFEVESDDSMYPWLLGFPNYATGVTHSDELIYVFSMPAIIDTELQFRTVDRMAKLWTNFAIYRDPTPVEDQEALDALGLPKWLPTTYEEPHYLLMQEEFTLEGEYTDRWTITMDEIREEGKTTMAPRTTLEPKDCQPIQDQRDAFLITMIVFIVAFVVEFFCALYFFFKARR